MRVKRRVKLQYTAVHVAERGNVKYSVYKHKRGTPDLVEHEAHISLLAEAPAQTVEDLQAKSFVGSRVVTGVDVHLDLSTGVILMTNRVTNCTHCRAFLAHTWLEEIAWLHWLDDKLPNTLKFFSSNKKPVTADFLPSSWLAKNHTVDEEFLGVEIIHGIHFLH